MYLPLIIVSPELSFSKLSSSALKCLWRNYNKTYYYGNDKFYYQYYSDCRDMIPNVEFLRLSYNKQAAAFSEVLRKNPNRPFPYPDREYQCYETAESDVCFLDFVDSKIISVECLNHDYLPEFMRDHRRYAMVVQLQDHTCFFSEYYGRFHNLEILDLRFVTELRAEELIFILDANSAIRDLNLHNIVLCPEIMRHRVMQQLETLTLATMRSVANSQDVALWTSYLETSELLRFQLPNHNPEVTKAALKAPKMVSMQINMTTGYQNPFTDFDICRLSHIISLSLTFIHYEQTYQTVYDAISNLPELQRFESDAMITIQDAALAQALMKAEKLVFFCMPFTGFTDQVLITLKPKLGKIVAWSCRLDATNSEHVKRDFCLSFENLLYYVYHYDGDGVMAYVDIINRIIRRNIMKIRFQAGLKHLAARIYGNHYTIMPELIPDEMQDLIKFYRGGAVNFEDLWNWLWIRNLL